VGDGRGDQGAGPLTPASSSAPAPSGAWTPGPELAGIVAARIAELTLDPSAGSASAMVGVAAAGFRLEGWALWCQLATIAALLRRWHADPPCAVDAVDGDAADPDARIRERADTTWDAAVRRARHRVPTPAEMIEPCVAAEIALACGISQSRAADRVLAAQVILLEGRLPRTAALLTAGLLDWPKIQLLTHRLGVGTHPVLAAAVERVLIPDTDLADVQDLDSLDGTVPVLPQVTRMTLPALTAAIDATLLALDPDAAAERARDARAERHVTTRIDPDGMARLEASTGAEQVAAMWTTLTTAARHAQRRGDPRTLDQLRLDTLLERVIGQPTTAVSGDLDRSSDDSAAANATRASATTGAAGGAAFGLTLPLTTFLEVADDPGILDGYGPIAGALARQIARDAARLNPATTTWRCVVVDDQHGTVLGVGRPVSTPHHDPPTRLADLARRAHPFCVFPGCRIPATRCDLDHRIPYRPGLGDGNAHHSGGATCGCNLYPLCRKHHRLKTAGLLTVRPDTDHPDHPRPPGGLIWTTSAGLTYPPPGPARDPAATACGPAARPGPTPRPTRHRPRRTRVDQPRPAHGLPARPPRRSHPERPRPPRHPHRRGPPPRLRRHHRPQPA
jgi:Domain of unknown function (DUF222)